MLANWIFMEVYSGRLYIYYDASDTTVQVWSHDVQNVTIAVFLIICQ